MAEGDANHEGLAALGRLIDATQPSHGPRWRRRLLRGSLVVALVALLAVGAGAGYVWYLNHEVHRVNVQDLTNDPTTGADAGTENILMVGSTSRCALKVQNPAYGLRTGASPG